MRTIKILWIDDMVSWAKSAQDILKIIAEKREIKLIFFSAINGEDLDICQKIMQYDLDCIVMDYHMEPQNGDKYIKMIREESELDFVPIIFYSQDNSVELGSLINHLTNVLTVYRPNLVDMIKEKFL